MGKEQLTLSIGGAAELLGVSRDFFDDHVRADLRLVRRGRVIRVPRAELERWVEQNAARTLA